MKTLLLVLAVSFTLPAMASDLPELKTVASVDLSRYLGRWYEIARYPNRFQRKCARNTTATYSLRDDGDIQVVNDCAKEDGSPNSVTGKAWISDKETRAKLRVQFFWPFSGNYWVIDLGKNYEYAVIGEPDRDYLWILSRTPKLEAAVYAGILERIRAQGYDPAKLLLTPQH